MHIFNLVLFLIFSCAAAAQTKHPLLLEMQKKAAAVEYGSYYIEAQEQYPYSKDTIFYQGHCAFSRFENFDGSPGFRYEVDMETRYPGLTNKQRLVFDGRTKIELRNDTLATLYDSRELGDDYTLRGLQHLFFVPLMLHEGQVKKYLVYDKNLGTPPYETLGDTLIGKIPCTLVGADWAPDSTGNLQHIRFGLSKATGLVVYFSHLAETTPEHAEAPIQKHCLEIRVQEWSAALPVNSFYIDWPSLPPTFEVRQFYDCYHRELLRPRNQPDL